MQRRNSDLHETNLKKRTLTATSSVNLDMTRSLSRSNLARSVSGSIPNMIRSTSSSSFAAVKINNRQDSSKKISKTKSTSNLGLSSKTPDNVDKLRKELEASQHLVSRLRAQVEQKEQIAALACNNIKVRNMLIHCLKQAWTCFCCWEIIFGISCVFWLKLNWKSLAKLTKFEIDP